MREPTDMTREIYLSLTRAMVWCGDAITQEQREVAWAWVEDHAPQMEEMGG